MKYVSTRGKKKYSFEEALFCCYAEDGGVMMPENIPTVEELKKWKNLSYVDIVKRIVSIFVANDEVPEDDQHAILDKAFEKFDTKNVVELAHLKDGLNIMELWHGDTLAFKDLAMTCTVQFLDYFLTKRKKHFTSIVVTSGDTGSSAMYAACNIPNIDLIVLYPHNRISALQEIMMTTLEGENLHLFAVEGNTDELDFAALNVLTDNQFVQKYNIGTMNSYNWCRIMVQIAHHVYGYLQTAPEVGKPVEIIVPCGGCGNITALMIAREMGVPIYPVGVCNKNDSFYEMVTSGNRVMKDVEVSIAPAMDISFTVNVERIIWLLSNKNVEVVKTLNEEYVKNKKCKLPDDVFKKMHDAIQSSVASDDVIINAIKLCWKENGYLLCPHTGAGVAHFYDTTKEFSKRKKSISTLCIATASAAKFAEVLEKAELPECKSEKIEKLRNLKNRTQRRIACSRIKPGVINRLITNLTINQLSYRRRFEVLDEIMMEAQRLKNGMQLTRAKYVAKDDNWEQIIRDQVIAVAKKG